MAGGEKTGGGAVGAGGGDNLAHFTRGGCGRPGFGLVLRIMPKPLLPGFPLDVAGRSPVVSQTVV